MKALLSKVHLLYHCVVVLGRIRSLHRLWRQACNEVLLSFRRKAGAASLAGWPAQLLWNLHHQEHWHVVRDFGCQLQHSGVGTTRQHASADSNEILEGWVAKRPIEVSWGQVLCKKCWDHCIQLAKHGGHDLCTTQLRQCGSTRELLRLRRAQSLEAPVCIRIGE
jgi:hypothetical protein